MDKKRAHSLRKKLDIRLIKLVKPEDMSIDEYRIACNLNEFFDASVENGSFLHWIITSTGDDDDIVDKVHAAVIRALDKKYLLDLDDKVQCSYFCDAIRDICIKDHAWAEQLFEVVLKNYKGTEVFNFCKTLNKAFGFTSIEYFN